jgi:hypothetical protein
LILPFPFIDEQQLIVLPCSPSIINIIEGYKKQNTNLDAETVLILDDIGPLFNLMAGKHLFYPRERLQYREILLQEGGASKLCSVYGSVHLLRLFGTFSLSLALL